MADKVLKTPKKRGRPFSGQPGPGRPKGLKNKIPQDLKKRVLAVWEELEAKNKGLGAEADKDPRWFYENFLKPMLPKNVDLSHTFDEPLVDIVRKLRNEKK